MKKLKLISLVFIFLILSLLLSIGYEIFLQKTPFFTLYENYSKDILTIPRQGELLMGDKVIGKFKSHDNFLGIVEVRFLTYGKVSSDYYYFRLKEIGNKDWYYENIYKAKQFGGYPLFPFGFPIINDSKDREYYFELESMHGKKGKAVEIDTTESIVVTVKHSYNKSYLLNHKDELIAFLLKKSKEFLFAENTLYLFSGIYLFLILSLVVLIKLPKIDIIPIAKWLENNSKREANSLSRLFIKLQLIVSIIFQIVVGMLLFALKILHSFHRWLGDR